MTEREKIEQEKIKAAKAATGTSKTEVPISRVSTRQGCGTSAAEIMATAHQPDLMLPDDLLAKKIAKLQSEKA